ncbi:hypothetical protein Moror_8302 [Moniliophthora roreri MCA 2997]|uniref:DUF7888 domain-containing protein n=2 Tax=Moniliophthora roreri TaxID=221103 RepID=V2XN17_MONRO|nr:hypothetical protein Moror_8302 [Moniliophthora roreri MCA 2997]KAI3607705.1 hypothetical protein WG66_005188 [Moniliophthora roreri]
MAVSDQWDAVKDWNGIHGRSSVKYSWFRLHTNWDCVYLGKRNAFWAGSEDGYIYLSYTWPSGALVSSAAAWLAGYG